MEEILQQKNKIEESNLLLALQINKYQKELELKQIQIDNHI